jgi:hypothetical protein
MKMKKIFLMAFAVAAITACVKNEPSVTVNANVNIDTTPPADHATITFACQGFEMIPFGTRAELTADGKSMTDLWILDYQGSTLAQQLRQVSTDDDFATPTLNLSVGDHHIYFIASRGKSPTLDTDAHTLTFGTVSDTFYKDYEINVTATSSGNRTVTLERCVTKLTAIITDAIPEGSATFNLTPEAWHYGIDYTTGQPISATPSQMITINIPSSEIGVANEPLNIFGFSGPDEWTTNVTLNCKKSDGTILGTATLTDVPLKRNRITTYSGPLFSAEGLTTVSLSSDWLEEHTGTW